MNLKAKSSFEVLKDVQIATPLFLFLFGLYQIFFGEHILANDGLGWGGFEYASLTQYLTKSPVLDSYLAYRMFIPAFFHFIFEALSISFSAKNIIASYHILHLILLPISAYFFVSILKHFKINNTIQWFAVILCFVNFATLRSTHYNPVYLDTPAFAISIFILHQFLKKENLNMLLLGLIGAFIFPTLFFQSICLFLINKPFELNKNKRYFYFLFYFIGIYAAQFYFFKNNLLSHQVPYVMQIHANFSWLSFAISALIGSFIIDFLTRINLSYVIVNYTKKEKLIKIAISLLLMIFVVLLAKKINVSEKLSQVIDSNNIGPNIFAPGNILPGINLISHLSYFGLVVLFIIFFWKRFLIVANKNLGFGFVFCTLIILFFFAIPSETRRFINLLPWLVIPIVILFNEINVSKIKLIIVLLLNLVASKFWLQLNYNEPCDVDAYGALNFPCQAFLMSHGPWMSYNMYWLQLMFFIFFAIIIFTLFKKEIFNKINNNG